MYSRNTRNTTNNLYTWKAKSKYFIDYGPLISKWGQRKRIFTDEQKQIISTHIRAEFISNVDYLNKFGISMASSLLSILLLNNILVALMEALLLAMRYRKMSGLLVR